MKKLKSIILSIKQGCKQAGCELVGGETAEMPSLYNEDDFDEQFEALSEELAED